MGGKLKKFYLLPTGIGNDIIFINIMLKCQYCNFEGKSLVSHIKHAHNESVSEYRKKYPGPMQLVTDDQRLRRREIAINGGTWRRVEYWTKRGYSIEEARQIISEKQSSINTHRVYKPEDSILTIEYWMTRHGYCEDDAIKKISELQSSRSSRSKKFKGKSHSIDSKYRMSVTMKSHIKRVGKELWIKHFGTFSGRSNIEIECYNEIKNLICNDLLANVYINGYVVDMLYNTKVIEFNGDYWHANPKIYSSNDLVSYPKGIILVDEIWKKDNAKISNLEQLGYSIYTIWESEWKQDKNAVLSNIKKFLNDSIQTTSYGNDSN
jgi:hypothetical protein